MLTQRQRTQRQRIQTAARLALVSLLGGAMLAAPMMPSRAEAEVLPSLPHVLEGRSGGNSYTNDCGYASDAANYTFRLAEAMSELSVSVSSGAIGADMTLAIEGPDGRMCLDDMNGSLMPIHEGAWPAGEYQVWVGDWGDSQPFTLTFE